MFSQETDAGNDGSIIGIILIAMEFDKFRDEMGNEGLGFDSLIASCDADLIPCGKRGESLFLEFLQLSFLQSIVFAFGIHGKKLFFHGFDFHFIFF